MTTSLLSEEIEKYTEKYTSAESPVLAELNRDTNLKRGDAVMLSGHLQGAVLQMLSHMISPSCVLEIGTYTGYSAICLAMGLKPGGKLHTIEIDEELYDTAAKYINDADMQDQVIQHTGVAAEIIPTITDSIDLVFIDADKSNYELYYDLVFDKVPVGGYIIADNVLYDGEVVRPPEEQSKNAKAICGFNEKVRTDTRVQRLLLPVRDGLMIVRKISA